MNPNHYLAVAIQYLVKHRSRWPAGVAVGKTMVSSSVIDRVVQRIGRTLHEVPVGRVRARSLDAVLRRRGGASFLRLDGTVRTDKDGLIMALLPPRSLPDRPRSASTPVPPPNSARLNTRVDAPATPAQKTRLASSPEAVTAATLAGEPITARLTRAPGNDAPLGGLKVVAESGWFAARPSGTENIYKIYAESFKDEGHLQAILREAQDIVSAVA